MEKTLLLKAEVREKIGRHAARNVRGKGLIPATIYGHGKTPASVSLDAHIFNEGLRHGARVIDIEIGSDKETTLIKDLQYDYLGKDIIHIDLMRVDVTETVEVGVPVELKGTAKGAAEGGVVQAHLDKLEVECRVTNIPETIVVSVKEMNIGDVIKAKDVVLPAEVKLITAPETFVASCNVVLEAKTTEELLAEAPAAPEVITEKKKEEEAEEEK